MSTPAHNLSKQSRVLERRAVSLNDAVSLASDLGVTMNNRASKYLNKIKTARPHIQKARELGMTNAREFAEYLNAQGVPAPTRATWSEDAVLRALRRLWSLRLDDGSKVASEARNRSGGLPGHRKVSKSGMMVFCNK